MTTPAKHTRAFHALCCVYDEPGALTVRDIAEDIGVEPKNLSSEVSRLIRADLLDRDDEGRLYITPDGIAHVEALMEVAA